MKLINILKYKVKDVKKGVSNLIKWFPTIWNDRDWDYEYLYAIIHKKLDSMETYYRRDNPITLESYKVADEIKEAKDLLYNAWRITHTKNVEDPEGGLNYLSADEKWMKEMKIAEEREDEDLQKALTIIAEKSKGWWD